MESLPALTKFYGITPMDVDRMTLREVSEYVAQLAKAQEEAERG